MIPAYQVEAIRKRIRSLDASVADKVAEVIEGSAGKGQDALRDAIFGELMPVCEEAFELSSQLAQAVYNGWRVIGLGFPSETVSASTFSQEKFDDMAYTALSKDSPADAANVINDYVGHNTRASYASTMVACANADPVKPRFARVPSGTETCRFCIMLASRGFVYLHGKGGGNVHNHANCDCVYVASWDDDPIAESYDPDYYYDVYKHPDQHPEIRDALNARRRELYAERKSAFAESQGNAEVEHTRKKPTESEARRSSIKPVNRNSVQKDKSPMFSSIFDYEAETKKRVAAPVSFRDKIFNEIENMGGMVQLADKQWLAYLEKKEAWAVTIGDAAVFRPDATRSELVEEMIHVRQNKDMLNIELGHAERQAVNEYLAHVELLESARIYGFTSDEVALTMRNRDIYLDTVRKMGLERYADNP